MRILRNLPIGIKIAVSASVLCILLLVASSVAIVRLIAVADRISTIGLAEMKWRDDVGQLSSKITHANQ